MQNRLPFLICVDSDGCVMDSMEEKHRKFFCPLLIEVWELQPYADLVSATWMEINLYSKTRGLNRFAAFALLVETLGDKLHFCCSIQPALQWIAQQKAPSHRLLEQTPVRGDVPALQRLYEWSCRVNSAIAQDTAPIRAFAGAGDCLRAAAQRADVLVVSSANRRALETEWRHETLDRVVLALLGQDDGSKQQCIAAHKDFYPAGHVLMIGDAPGDFAAARANGVLFYPILAGQEPSSWAQAPRALEHFFAGSYAGAAQNALLKDFFANLHMEPPAAETGGSPSV